MPVRDERSLDRVGRIRVAHRMRTRIDMEAGTTQTNVQKHELLTAGAARERATAALAQLEGGHRDAMEELRQTLCAYVGALRREGSTREATLDTVRSFVATPVTPDGALGLTPIVRDALAELTLQWCQAEYDRLAADEGA
jgi:hypothetical protein